MIFCANSNTGAAFPPLRIDAQAESDVETAGKILVHNIINNVFLGLYIQFYACQIADLLLQVIFPDILCHLQQFLLGISLSAVLKMNLTL